MHSDFIDVNAKAKEIIKEKKEQKQYAFSKAFGGNTKQTNAPKYVSSLPSDVKPRESAQKAKEREAFEKYMKIRELRN
jgi:hypothetical protein